MNEKREKKKDYQEFGKGLRCYYITCPKCILNTSVHAYPIPMCGHRISLSQSEHLHPSLRTYLPRYPRDLLK